MGGREEGWEDRRGARSGLIHSKVGRLFRYTIWFYFAFFCRYDCYAETTRVDTRRRKVDSERKFRVKVREERVLKERKSEKERI